MSSGSWMRNTESKIIHYWRVFDHFNKLEVKCSWKRKMKYRTWLAFLNNSTNSSTQGKIVLNLNIIQFYKASKAKFKKNLHCCLNLYKKWNISRTKYLNSNRTRVSVLYYNRLWSTWNIGKVLGITEPQKEVYWFISESRKFALNFNASVTNYLHWFNKQYFAH